MPTLNRFQYFTILSALALLVILFFGFDTKPDKLLREEKTRSLNQQITSVSILRSEAIVKLEGDQRSVIQVLESRLENTQDFIDHLRILEELSNRWFDYNAYAIAGNYAEEIAKITGKAEAWGIAGTTYALGIRNSEIEKERLLCFDKSLESLENAMSLAPENIDFQLNRAIVYAEHPIEENPMKGIQLLLDLNKKYPKNVPVINNLARFALQTNQLERAIDRLKIAETLDPDNKTTNCLLAQAYERIGNKEKNIFYKNRCDLLN